MSQMKDPITTEEVESFKKVFESHWAEHPDYPVEDWREEVQADDTRLGYWEWVYKQEYGDALLYMDQPEEKLTNNDVQWALKQVLSLVGEWLADAGNKFSVDQETWENKKEAYDSLRSTLLRSQT